MQTVQGEQEIQGGAGAPETSEVEEVQEVQAAVEVEEEQ